MCKKYLTPNEEAKQGYVTITQLRQMIKQGKCPGFYVGESKTHFRVDHDALVEQLRRESLATCGR